MGATFLVIVVLAHLGLPIGANSPAPLMVQPEDRIPNEYIVMLQPNLTPLSSRVEAFKQYTSRHRLTGVDILGQVQMREFAALHVRAADDAALELLRMYEDISIVTTNNLMKVHDQGLWTSEVDMGPCIQQEPQTTPWGLIRTSYEDKPDYSPTCAYSYNEKSGSDVTVYVIDSGIYIEHNDFEGRAVWGFTASNLSTYEGDVDLNGHGTHVAGTIGGAAYGIAKKVKLVAVKVLGATGGSDEFGTIEGMAWACNDFLANHERDKKFKAVINMSLGGPPDAIEEAAEQLCNEWGMIFVVAAGNEADDACNVSPARVSSAITVGASDRDDTMAFFSNWGPCVDILAPGVDILSCGITGPDSTEVLPGTSMASPHVAGVVARYLSGLHEQPSPAQVKAAILDMAQVNKIDFGQDANHMSTPNLLLYFPCAEAEVEETSSGNNDVLAVTSITLTFVCILLAAAILAGAFWGYTMWKKHKGSDPYVARAQETSSTRDLPMA